MMDVSDTARELCAEVAELQARVKALAASMPDPPAAMVNGEEPMERDCDLLGALEVCEDQLSVGAEGLEQALSRF